MDGTASERLGHSFAKLDNLAEDYEDETHSFPEKRLVSRAVEASHSLLDAKCREKEPSLPRVADNVQAHVAWSSAYHVLHARTGIDFDEDDKSLLAQQNRQILNEMRKLFRATW